MTDAPDILETAQKALELSAKATAGPWEDAIGRHDEFILFHGDAVTGVVMRCSTQAIADLASFARDNIEALAREVIRLRGEKTEANDWINGPLLEQRNKATCEAEALREVERAAREFDGLIDLDWCASASPDLPEVKLHNAIAALDELRGGTGE